MPEAVRCPDCGMELVSEPGIAGLCPQCLFSLALQDSSAEDSPLEAVTFDRPAPGRILGERYQVRELLGRGGMERVENERARELLRREVRSAREVVSPNACRIAIASTETEALDRALALVVAEGEIDARLRRLGGRTSLKRVFR